MNNNTKANEFAQDDYLHSINLMIDIAEIEKLKIYNKARLDQHKIYLQSPPDACLDATVHEREILHPCYKVWNLFYYIKVFIY